MNGFGYAPAEALKLGVPVIVTPCPAFLEIGIKDRENAFVIDYNMANIPVKEIYKGLPKIKYESPKDRWNELLVEGKSTYLEDMTKIIEIQVIKRYNDVFFGREVKAGEKIKVDVNRAEYLVEDRGLARYI